MDYKLLLEKYDRCCQLVIGKQLSEAFLVLTELVKESRNGELTVQLEKHQETYSNILRYSFGEVTDPEKKTVYYHLLQSVLELADNVRGSIILSHRFLSYYNIKQDPESRLTMLPEEVGPFIGSLYWDTKDIDNETKEDSGNTERQKKIIQLFNLLWLTDIYKDTEKELATLAIKSNVLPWWDQCLVISAITLSLQRHFDETKLNLLAGAYTNNLMSRCGNVH
jgi:hypothetical protein